MNIVAFQSWLSGYLDNIGTPNAAQLARIREKLETVEAADRTDALIADMLKEHEKITAKNQATMADLAAMEEAEIYMDRGKRRAERLIKSHVERDAITRNIVDKMVSRDPTWAHFFILSLHALMINERRASGPVND